MKITGYAQSRTILCKVKNETLLRDLESLSRRNNWQLDLVEIDTDLLAIGKFAAIIDRTALPDSTWRSYLSFSKAGIDEGVPNDCLHLFLDKSEEEETLESKVISEPGELLIRRIEYELRNAHRVNANRRLREYYEGALPGIQGSLISFNDVSSPLFLSVTEEYEQSKIKVLIVGQQTNGWDVLTNSTDEILECYTDFQMGVNYRNSPFWRAACQLNDEINPVGPERAFLWSNLVKVDQDGERPSNIVEELIGKSDLLQEEMRILQPQVVIFLTGPYYDERLEATFPGIENTQMSRWTRKLYSKHLPDKSYRTYHPSWLVQSGNWDELKAIVTDIRAV